MKICSSFLRYIYNSFSIPVGIWNKSLRYKLTILVILIVLIPMSFSGIYIYSNMYNMLTENINKELSQYMRQINDNLVSQFRMVDNIFMLFLSDKIIRTNLEQDLTEDQVYLRVKSKMEVEEQLKYTLINNNVWDSKLVNSVFVFKNEFTYYYLVREYIPDNEAIDELINFYRQSKKLEMETSYIFPSPKYNTIYFMRDIKNLNTFASEGKILLGVDENILINAYSSILKFSGTKAFIFDDQGTIFFHTDKNMQGKKIPKSFVEISNSNLQTEYVDGEQYYIASQNISNIGMTSVIMVPQKQVMQKLSKSIYNYLIMIIFTVLVSLAVSLFMTANITKPIRDLIMNINRVKSGDFSTKMPTYNDMEINELSTVFNKMTDEIQYLFKQVYEKQLLLKESELESLQSQVNPHFLFNVLESISWEARMSNNENIYKMISSLGELLRASINMGAREKITIREELRYIEFYLYLQKIRFGDKLTIDIQISDPSILDYYLPKLCIQPIVENAIVHGLESKRGTGCLFIKALKDNGTVFFEVIDDGIGFDVEIIKFDCIDSVEYRKQEHKSIGMFNSNKRIKLLYGDEYGLTIDSKIGKGTKVIIAIPIDRSDA